MTREEQKVWLKYLITQLKLKHDFEIVDMSKSDAMIGRGIPDKIVGSVGFKYHWNNLKYQSFDDFKNNKGMYGYYWFKTLTTTNK